MPLPMKTLREVAAEVGIPEAELRVMVDSKKVRAFMRQGQLTIAPDEIAKMKRLRKTLQDSARTSAPATPPPAKPAPPGTFAPAKPAAAAKPTSPRPAPPKPT
jgi:hypothetical protein